MTECGDHETTGITPILAGVRGGKRPGAGRPAGSIKPDRRPHVLAQRYSDAELDILYEKAERAGYGSDLGNYIRDTMTREV